MESRQKGNKGITLIILVVTVIILLILASIAIVALSGDNGILKNAVEAKEKNKRQDIVEQAQLAIFEKQVNKPSESILKSDIKEVLDVYFKDVPEDFNIDTILNTKEEYGNFQILLSEIYNGNIKEKGLTAIDIVNAENKEQIYGAEVKDYVTADSEKAQADSWQIFYAGTVGEEKEPHIYLISSNYIEYTYIPNSTKDGVITNNKPNNGSSNYPKSANFSTVLNDYVGSENIIERNIQALNDSYFNQEYTSTNDNIKSVAYMLDTNAWRYFTGDKAEWTIGGPTIELLFKSYNEKYKTKYISEATSVTGYQIKKNESDSWNYVMLDILNESDNLYVIHSTNNALGMWIASPSGDSKYKLMNVNSSGDVYCNNYSYNNLGFRPIVCLKTNVELQKNIDENGNVYYTIY